MALFDGLSTPRYESPADLGVKAAQGAGDAGQLFGAALRQRRAIDAEKSDPFAELKALQIMTQMKAAASQLADSELSRRMKENQIDSEAADKRAFTDIITNAKGDEDKILERLSTTQWMSPMGRDNATQLRLATVARKSRDAFSKAISKLTPQGIARVSKFEPGSPEAWQAIEDETVVNNLDIREIEVGGKKFAIFQVPGSKAFQLKDLSELSPVDMINYRSATRRRDTAIADMADPIKGIRKAELQRIVSDAESEMSRLVKSASGPAGDSPSSAATNAPAASPKTKAQRANELSADHPDWTREQIIEAVNREMP